MDFESIGTLELSPYADEGFRQSVLNESGANRGTPEVGMTSTEAGPASISPGVDIPTTAEGPTPMPYPSPITHARGFAPVARAAEVDADDAERYIRLRREKIRNINARLNTLGANMRLLQAEGLGNNTKEYMYLRDERFRLIMKKEIFTREIQAMEAQSEAPQRSSFSPSR